MAGNEITKSQRSLLVADSNGFSAVADKVKGELGLTGRIFSHFSRNRNKAKMLTAIERDIDEARRETIRYALARTAEANKMEIQDRFAELTESINKRVVERTLASQRFYTEKAFEEFDRYEDYFDGRLREVEEKRKDGRIGIERAERETRRIEEARDKRITAVGELQDIMIKAIDRSVAEAFEEIRRI